MQESMLNYEFIAITISLLKNKRLWNGMLAGTAFLFFNLLFPFYSWPALIGLTILVIIIGYNIPQLAMVLELILSLPAVSYQSPGLAWFYMLSASAILVIVIKDYVNKSEYSERNWRVAAIIQLLVSVSFLTSYGVLLILPLFTISSFYLSSKRVIPVMIIILTVTMLLSSLGNVTEVIPLSGNYEMINTNKPMLESSFNLLQSAINSLSNMFIESYSLNDVGGILLNNFIELVFNDTYLIVIILWTLPLFLISYIPGHVRMKYEQTLSSLLIFLIPLEMLSLGTSNFFVWLSAVLSVIIIFILESLGIKISREEEVVLREREKKFMQFGLKELTSTSEVNSLNDVGNYDSIKNELKESVLLPLIHKDLVAAYGIKPTRGLLLFGPPGTGKTLIMTALSKEINYGFFYVRSSSLTSPAFGVSAKNITRLFKVARKNQPCILFFDEIDAIGKKRELLSEFGSQMLTSLLQELDGFKTNDKVIVVGATNKPEVLDPALMRPGRIDKIIYMPPPDKEGRKAIFKILSRKLRKGNIDYDKLAELTEGFTGADIKVVCEEVNRKIAKKAIKKNKIINITTGDFINVIKNMTPSVTPSELKKYEMFRSMFERKFFKSAGEKEIEGTKKGIINMEKVLMAVEDAYAHKQNLLLFGPSGNGKSLVVKYFAKKQGLNVSVLDCSDDITLESIKSLSKRKGQKEIILVEKIEELPPKLIKKFINIMKNKKFFATSVAPWLLPKNMLRLFNIFVLVGLPNTNSRRMILNQFGVDDEYLIKGLAGCTYSEVIKIGHWIQTLKMKGNIKNINLDDEIHIILSKANKVTQEDIKLYKEFMDNIKK